MDTMDTTEADGLTIDEGIIWRHLMRLTGQVRFSGGPSTYTRETLATELRHQIFFSFSKKSEFESLWYRGVVSTIL